MDARTNIEGRLPSRHATEGLARAALPLALTPNEFDQCCAAPAGERQ